MSKQDTASCRIRLINENDFNLHIFERTGAEYVELLMNLMDNPFAYHYTSLETVFAILEGFRKDRNLGLPFRANCIYNQNDPREMELGYSAVKRFLPEFEANHPQSMNLAEVYLNKENDKRCLEQCLKKPVDGMIESGEVPYSISFSCKRDFLPMWSMYGENKKGACLRFKICKLVNDTLPDGTQIDFVSYDEEKNDCIVNRHFARLYNFDACKKNRKQLTIEDKISDLAIYCQCISPFIKSIDWSYEKEFRIVYNKNYSIDIHDELFYQLLFQLPQKKKVLSYVNYPINANALEEIIIGPMANYNVVEHILRKELQECHLSSVVVTPSAIAIR